jgi:hypothetical protein
MGVLFEFWRVATGDCWNEIPRTFDAPGNVKHDVWLASLMEWRKHHLKHHGLHILRKIVFWFFQFVLIGVFICICAYFLGLWMFSSNPVFGLYGFCMAQNSEHVHFQSG